MNHNSNFKRLVCCLLAVLVLCTCVVRPLTVKAFTPTALNVGLAAACILITGGLVLEIQAVEDLTALTNSFTDSLIEWARKNDKVDAVDIFLELLAGEIDWQNYKLGLPSDIFSGIAAWLYDVLSLGGIGTGETVSEGWSYYGEHLLPEIPEAPDGSSYTAIGINSSGDQYTVFYSPSPFVIYEPFNELRSSTSSITYYFHSYSLGDAEWSSLRSQDIYTLLLFSSCLIPVWADHDVCSQTDKSTVLLPASAPSSEKVTITHPGADICDIPSQVQNGTLDADDLEEKLPATFDFSGIFADSDAATAEDALMELIEKLQTGAITYEEYMNAVAGADVGSDVVVGSTVATTPWATFRDWLKSLLEGIRTAVVSVPQSVADALKPSLAPDEYTLSLKDFFPFCIPYDIYNLFNAFSAAPETPVWEINLDFGQSISYTGTIDLSMFDEFASIARKFQVVGFCIYLAFSTKKILGW